MAVAYRFIGDFPDLVYARFPLAAGAASTERGTPDGGIDFSSTVSGIVFCGDRIYSNQYVQSLYLF